MLVMGGKYAKKNNIINLIFNRSSVIFIYTNTGQCPFKHQITPLQTAQGNRCSSIAHLGRKNVLARARQVAPQSYATLASTAGTRLAALLSLRYRYVWCSLRACQLVFSSKRSLSRHPRLLLPPNPSRFRYRSILLHWVQPPLIVRLACGSRGRRAVIVFALLRFVSFAPALIS